MNKTALAAAMNCPRFSVAMYKALHATARRGHSVAHVCNRKGVPVIAVRYDVKNGFSFRDRSGTILDKQTIFSALRGF